MLDEPSSAGLAEGAKASAPSAEDSEGELEEEDAGSEENEDAQEESSSEEEDDEEAGFSAGTEVATKSGES